MKFNEYLLMILKENVMMLEKSLALLKQRLNLHCNMKTTMIDMIRLLEDLVT